MFAAPQQPFAQMRKGNQEPREIAVSHLAKSHSRFNRFALRAAACATLFAALQSGAAPDANPPLPSQARVQGQLAALAVPFEANRGQFDARVAFAARTFTGSLFVTHDGRIVHSLLGREVAQSAQPARKHERQISGVERGPGWALVEAPLAARSSQPAGGLSAPVSVARFSGNAATGNQAHIDTYQRVEMGEVWPGVTLSLAARGANVEKIFTLASNIESERIAMKIDGAALSVTNEGSLVAHTGNGPVTFTAPVAWQIVEAGEQVPVDVSYRLTGDSVYGFSLGTYDPAYPVVIDPLVQATYLGGSGTDDARAMALDAAGNVLVAGYTQSADFPGTAGGYHTGGGDVDAFVARLNSTLTGLMQATYFGGTGSDIATSLRVDASGNVFVAGYTYSSDFPVTVGTAQTTKSGDATTTDAFIVRFNSTLSSLDRGTYLGGGGVDAINALVMDGTAVIVAGQTTSTTFPGTSGATQAAIGGLRDAFLARLTTDLVMTRATYLGGSGEDEALSLAISGTNLYVAGYTSSTNFPAGTTSAGVFTTNAGGIDGFVARFTTSLLTRSRTTYLGGAGEDMALSVAVDTAATPNVVVAGYTESTNFPAGSSGTGAQTTNGGGTDAFVARFNDTLTSMFRSTYLGGGGTDVATAVMVHPSGDIYVTGYTSSDDSPGPPFPGVKSAASCTAPCIVPGAGSGIQPDSGGSMDAFVTRFNTTLATHTQSTYLGGSAGDAAYAIAAAATPASPGNNVLIAGYTGSTNFRGTAGGAQPAYGGKGDVFVALMSLGLQDAAGDQKPNTFKLVDQVNVTPGSVVTSAPLQISGITVATPISVTGGQYCVSATNSCASCTFGTASGTINNNEYVCVRHTAAAGNGAITRTVLTIYGDSSTFSSTTSPVTPDTDAAPFTFGTRTNVTPSSQITSGPVQITGINLPAAISIAGTGNPQYCVSSVSDPVTPCSCDVRAYGSTTATISAGQFVCVRHDAAVGSAAQTVTTLNVGATQGTLTSTTLASGADIDPAPFAFVNQNDVPLMVAVTSAPVQITGIDTPSPISVTGGQYCISSGADCLCNVRLYSTAPATISAGQHVCVKHTTPGAGSTVTSTTVTVGSVSGTFNSTTGVSDTTPNAFTFASQNGVALNATVISAPTQITGINTQVLATIAGGGNPQYCISSANDCACDLQQFTNTSAPVTNGRYVCIRHTSAGTNGAPVSSTLSIGGVDGVFTSTTTLPAITLTVAKSGTGLGTVTSSPSGINCGPDCSEGYASGTVVTLTAAPNPGSEFVNWTGVTCNGGNTNATCVFTLTAPVTATAALLRDNPAVPDFNADTRPDILWRHTPSGSLYVWYMNGPTLISDQYITNVDPSWKLDGVADFNGDGHPDIVWRNGTGDTYVWYLVNGVFQSDAFLFSLPPEWVIQGVADFNADGKPDFLMRNTVSGNAFAWFFNNNVAIGDQFLFNIDPSWKVEGVADLNADGQPDLLFRNMNSGLGFAWNTQFSGGALSLSTSSPPIFGIDTFWEIVQIADWNNDGKPDLLFRNRNTGVVFVWYLDGIVLTTSDYITQIDPIWEIVPRR